MRKQVFIKFAVLLIIIAVILVFLSTFVLKKELLSLERIVLKQQLEMFDSLLQTKRQDFVNKTKDWAIWDDAYQYMQSRNPGFVSNFHENTFINVGINYVICLNKDGRILTAVGYDLKNKRSIAVPDDLIKKLSPKVLETFADSSGIVAGYAKVDDKVLMLAAVPINTNDKKSVSNGWIVFAADMDENYFKVINQIKNTHTALDSRDFFALAKDAGTGLQLDNGTDVAIKYNSNSSVSGFFLLKDISNNAVAGLRVDLPRSVMQNQNQYIAYALGISLAIILVLAVGCYFVVGSLLKYIEE
ncbi:MAG: CHASE4 domain-containing protein [Negativicutes bacterium]|jgi:hypothetical protein